MNFKEFRVLSEAKKDLYSAIGQTQTDKLLNTKVDPDIHQMHDHVFGVGNHHIEMPLENDVPEKVKSHIESQGDSLEGENVKLKSGRLAPISKYLAKANAPKDVQDEHQNWARSKVGNSKLVITRHAGEVASASTGTHWSSCANATAMRSSKDRPAWNAMPHELRHGTLMAMHVHKDAEPDRDGNYASKDVLGRTLIKRHDADDDSSNTPEISFHREDKSYGAFPESAKKAVDNFTAKNYPQKCRLARKERSVYDDDRSDVKANYNHPDIGHAFTHGHDKELSHQQQHSLVNADNVPQQVYDHAAMSSSSSVRDIVAFKSKNPATINKVYHDPRNTNIADIESTAAANPHAPKNVIDHALTHHDWTRRNAAARNTSATLEQITTASQDKHPTVRSNAARHQVLNK